MVNKVFIVLNMDSIFVSGVMMFVSLFSILVLIRMKVSIFSSREIMVVVS